jgi:hypothetical protein
LFAIEDDLEWLPDLPAGMLGFTRGESACIINYLDHETPVPISGVVEVSSAFAPRGVIASNSGQWLRRASRLK